MMREYEVKWNTARATYDLYVDGEWYAEDTDYDRIDDMMRRMKLADMEEYEHEEDTEITAADLADYISSYIY